jgi:4-hydroxy-tetrahydrodipicolinate reductase
MYAEIEGIKIVDGARLNKKGSPKAASHEVWFLESWKKGFSEKNEWIFSLWDVLGLFCSFRRRTKLESQHNRNFIFMKIALIGYGKMGKAIEQIALQEGHEVVLRIDVDNTVDFSPENLQKADVAIEFTRPETAFANLQKCLEAGTPVVVGTTGWLQHLEEAKAICAQHQGALFYSSNYSIGVNIFFAVNRFLAKMMNEQSQYEVRMAETHHTQKLDAPSGTAITLAEGILSQLSRKTRWVNGEAAAPDELSILSSRIDPAPGTHEIYYESSIDSIEIRHTAHSREGFARGALHAAVWLVGKKGVFNMSDLLDLL